MPYSRRRMQLTLALRVPQGTTHRPPEPHCLTRHKTIHPAARCKIARRFAGESSSLTPAAFSMPMRPGRKCGCDRPSRRRHSCKESFRSLRPFTTIREATLAARSLCCKPASGVWLVSRTRIAESRWALCARKRRPGSPRWPANAFRGRRSRSRTSNLQGTIESTRAGMSPRCCRLRKLWAGIEACRTSLPGTADGRRA
jgi:hypothetical protein